MHAAVGAELMVRSACLLAGNDLRMLLRTRALVVMLVVYPLVIAAILGAILLHQGPPRVAFVNEDLSGDTISIGHDRFSVSQYVHRAERKGVDVVETSRAQAEHMLDEGQVAGVLIVPQGTVARLQTQLSGAHLIFETGDNAFSTVVAQRMRGVIYDINLRISDALIAANLDYLHALVSGRDNVAVGGRTFDLYGLTPTGRVLRAARSRLAADPANAALVTQLDSTIRFADLASTAIGLADNALEAAAAPVRITVRREQGKSPLLTAQAMGFALAASITFVCMVLVAASLAAERDEAVLGRLLRGLASPRSIVLGKLLVGSAIAL
ncbi:MAG: transporter permease, partial [Thermoleophilia bacterium]|nr:transporter permease [Thermoleophilia bacterium]